MAAEEARIRPFSVTLGESPKSGNRPTIANAPVPIKSKCMCDWVRIEMMNPAKFMAANIPVEVVKGALLLRMSVDDDRLL